MKKTVGNRIRRIRQSQNFTQENIADELGIEAGTYAKIERGETDVQVTRLESIAKVLKVNIVDFFQDKKDSLTDEHFKQYGFAAKADIEQLTQMILQLKKEFEQFKNKVGGDGRKGSGKRK